MSDIKGKLKYVSGICLFLSLGIIALPILKLGELKLSGIDIIRILLDKYRVSVTQRGALDVIREYMQTYIFSVLCWILFTLLVVLLITLIQSRVVYIVGIIGQIADVVFAFVLFFLLEQKMDGMKQVVLYYDLGKTVEIVMLPVLIWGGLQGIAFLMNLIGIIVTLGGRKWEEELIDIEENIYAEPLQKKRPEQKSQKVEMVYTEKSYHTGNQNAGFEGAILGLEKMYKGKVFPMNALELVTICATDDTIQFVKEEVKEEIKCAALYYIPQYEEYCVIPQKRRSVYLESGQPLGAGRQYYIPRGEKIEVYDCNGKTRMRFELA